MASQDVISETDKMTETKKEVEEEIKEVSREIETLEISETDEMTETKKSIIVVQEDIKTVCRKIETVVIEEKSAKGDKLTHLREREGHLRKKEEQLRKKEEQLRKKEEQLRDKEGQLRELSLNLEPDPQATKFMKALKRTSDSGDVMVISECIPWFKNSSRVFVRTSYVDIAEEFWKCEEDLLLLGSPGIGKSMFLVYLLHQALMKEKAVLFLSIHKCTLYYFKNDVVFSCNSRSPPHLFDKVCKEGRALYFVDAGTNQSVNVYHEKCRLIIASSPTLSNYSDFSKDGIWKLHMPIWTEEEIVKLHSKCYDDAYTSDGVHQRFNVFGGIPRYIFCGEGAYAMIFARRKQALSKCTIATLASVNDVDLGQESHTIFHHCVEPGEYNRSTIKLCCDMDALYTAISKKENDNLLEFLISTKGAPLQSGVRGQLFEPFSLRIVSRGGRFERRNLFNDKTDHVIFPNREHVNFFKLEDIKEISPPQISSPRLLLPSKRNLEALDALSPAVSEELPATGFQCTISTTHPIKGKGIINAMEALQVEQLQRFTLYFVVPEDVFSEFKTQNYVTKEMKIYERFPKQLKFVDQYVLNIPLLSKERAP